MFTPVNNNKNRSNNKSNNNNNKNNKQPNTRFNFISEELKTKEEKSKSDKPKDNKPKEEKSKEEKPKEQKPKSDKPKNDRFNMEKLMVEEENQRNEQRNELRNNYSQNIPIIQSSVPIAIHNPEPNIVQIIKEDDFPDLKTISQNKVTKNTISNTNSYKKAINYENIPVECEENKKPIVPTGWVYIVKNKTGKSDIIYGPKTEEQKRKEYLSTNLNYQMCLSISNMEEKWNRYEQLYDSFHGENAFRERYGYVPTYDTDEDDYDYDETEPSDDDYDDYESE
jgi:hypothetical protein